MLVYTKHKGNGWNASNLRKLYEAERVVSEIKTREGLIRVLHFKAEMTETVVVARESGDILASIPKGTMQYFIVPNENGDWIEMVSVQYLAMTGEVFVDHYEYQLV